MIAHEEVTLLASVLKALPPWALRALLLCKLEARSHAEVAVIMRISTSGIEKHIAVAMKYLRRALLNWGDCAGRRHA